MRQHAVEPSATPPPSAYTPLIIQYSLMAVYGLGTGITGVATLDAVAGDLFGVVWPFLVVASSLAALTGVIISKATNRHTVEVVFTLGLMILLCAYSIAIIVRAASDHSYNGLPFAILPVALCVFPYTHLLSAVRGKLAR